MPRKYHMRYLLLTYCKKPNGQTDEIMAVSKNIKKRDIQNCNVILDFKKLTVVKASLEGNNVEHNFDRIAGYYHQHYASTIERLFKENGYEVELNTASANASS